MNFCSVTLQEQASAVLSLQAVFIGFSVLSFVYCLSLQSS